MDFNFGYRDMEVLPSEFKALYNALDRLLADATSPTMDFLTLDGKTPSARLQSHYRQEIVVRTGMYWGFWKLVTRNEQLFYLTRSQALKLRHFLSGEIKKRRKTTLVVSASMLNYIALA